MKSVKLFQSLFLLVCCFFFISCSEEEEQEEELAEMEMPALAETTIWSGATISFQKLGGADPELAENQDRITANVWITRGNSGGQIYNAASEMQADKTLSPAGTLWARGTTENLENLTFDRFRATLEKPKDNVGVDLVLLLVEENIAIDLRITSWSQQEIGAFAYERSSNQ